MEEELDKGMDEVMEEIADDLGYKQKSEAAWRRKEFPSDTSRRNAWILGGAALFVLLILIFAFSRGGQEVSKKDFKALQSSVAQLDERLRQLEKMEGRIGLLEKQGRELQQSILDQARSGRALSAQLGRMSQEISRLKGKPVVAAKKSAPQGQGKFYEVQPGDTVFGIAQKLGLSPNELLRANNLGPKQLIKPGQKLRIPLKAQ